MGKKKDIHRKLARETLSHEQLEDLALRIKLMMFSPGKITDYVIFKAKPGDTESWVEYQKNNR